MGMRRLFVIRTDLHLTTGKVAAMVGHLSEAYLKNLLKGGRDMGDGETDGFPPFATVVVDVPRDVWEEYVSGNHKKVVCGASGLRHLMKAVRRAKDAGLAEDRDFGLIRDCCFTELSPEDADGRTTVGFWTAPIPDETAIGISKPFRLLPDFCDVEWGE